MPRKKLDLAYIAKSSARRLTFKKRRRGLLKKAYELSTLCDLTVCVIVYGEDEHVPVTWPEETSKVEKIIDKFNELAEIDKMKKMLNQEGFLRKKVSKLTEELAMLSKNNKEMELKTKLFDGIADGSILLGAGMEEVSTLTNMVEDRYAKVKTKLESLRPQAVAAEPPPYTPPVLAMPNEDQPELSSMDQLDGGQSMDDILNSIDCSVVDWSFVDPLR